MYDVRVILAIKVSALELTSLHRDIYGLEIDEQILVKLSFDDQYMRNFLQVFPGIPRRKFLNYR